MLRFIIIVVLSSSEFSSLYSIHSNSNSLHRRREIRALQHSLKFVVSGGILDDDVPRLYFFITVNIAMYQIYEIHTHHGVTSASVSCCVLFYTGMISQHAYHLLLVILLFIIIT